MKSKTVPDTDPPSPLQRHVNVTRNATMPHPHHELYSQAMATLPMDFSAAYTCPKCHRQYAAQELAMACAGTDEPVNPLCKPGSIVLIDIGYGWFDGLEHWLVKSDREHHGRPLYDAYFIVTSVDWGNMRQTGHDVHRACYSVKTLGIKNGNKTGLCGWTRSQTHKSMKSLRDPDPRLLEEGKSFIGEVYEHLL